MSNLPEKSEQIIRSHAILIITVVKACQNPQLLPEVEPMLVHAQNNGWTALVTAIRNILKGNRAPSVLAGLDDEDTIIVDAILREIRFFEVYRIPTIYRNSMQNRRLTWQPRLWRT